MSCLCGNVACAHAAQAIIVAMLRQLSCWSDEDRSPEALEELAAEVERHDFTASWCCPTCQADFLALLKATMLESKQGESE